MMRTHRSVWLRGFIIPLGLLVGVTFILPTTAPSRSGDGPADPQTAGPSHPEPVLHLPSPHEVPTEKASSPELTSKEKRELMKSYFKKTKDDVAQLADMVNGLRDELDKTSANTFSLAVIHKAENIEKLARKIKKEAKGYQNLGPL